VCKYRFLFFKYLKIGCSTLHMRAIKQATIVVFALLTTALIAGCAPSAQPGGADTGGANSTVSSDGQQQNEPQMVTPLSQPLMATGGDLVMLPVRSPGIAGVTSGC
jgi:hypothetical protein